MKLIFCKTLRFWTGPVLKQKMLCPQGEGPKVRRGDERRGRASSIPGIWILPNIFLPSQIYCDVLQVSRSPEKQAHFIKICIYPAYHKIIIIPFRI